MVGVSGADEPVEGDVQLLLQALEHIGIALRQLRGGNALCCGRLDHLEAVLIGAGQKPDVKAVQPLEPRDGIGGDVLIRMPDVRLAIRVGDRGGDIVGLIEIVSTLLCARGFQTSAAAGSRAVKPADRRAHSSRRVRRAGR